MKKRKLTQNKRCLTGLIGLVLISLGTLPVGCKPSEEKTLGSHAESPQEPQKEVESKSEISKTNVEIMVLTPQKMEVRKSYVGELSPSNRVILRSESEGVIERVNFEESFPVTQDQGLVNISTEENTVRLELAESDFEIAQINYQRDLQLFEKKLIPLSQRDQVYYQLQTAKHRLKLAKITLAKSVLHSPLSGIVKLKAVEKGEFVNKGQIIAEILNIDPLKIVIFVPEQDIIFLKVGQKVEVELYVLQHLELSGRIDKLGIEADSGNRGFPVEVRIPNPKGDLRSGMLAKVNIRLNTYENQVVIPRYAVLEKETERAVFLVHKDLVEERPIKIAESYQGYVRVISGLKTGDSIVVKGQQELNHNEQVQIRDTIQQPLN
ncbi:efflux RND transporter periplasmic adaptor subunit [Deltaproteobacteria bacterium TL4]